jgi:hypothetical protein
MKKAVIYLEGKELFEINYDYFTSNVEEKAYFFMLEKTNVAIIPHNYLIIFKKDHEKTKAN